MNVQTRGSRKPKSTKGLWITLAVILLVVLSIGGWLFYSRWRADQLAQQRQEAVEETVNSMLAAKSDAAFDSYVSYMSPETLEEFGYSPDELAERYEMIFQGIGANDIRVNDYAVELDEETDKYTVRYMLSMETALGRLDSLQYETAVIETETEDTQHVRLSWSPSLILPDMEEGDSVRLSFNEPERGSIVDRYGNMLAGEGDVFQAGLYPAAIGEGSDRESRLEAIAEAFNVSADRLQSLLSQSWVTEESFVPFTIVETGNTPEIQGVRYQQSSDRLYPLDRAAAHLIGYVGEANAEDLERDPSLVAGQIIGKTGLEAVFNDQLSGITGGQIAIENSEGELKAVLIENETEDGQKVRLTIDSAVQEELFESFDEEPGSGAIMDPVSGELLALVSSPSYSPQAFARGITTEDYTAYVEDENTPFVNRYTSRYAPGSTFKILTSLLLLEEGEITPDQTNRIEGLRWSPGTDGFGNHQITRVSDSVTEVDLAAALIYSDNIYFAMEALEMGNEAFMEALNQLPFGEDMNLPFDMRPAQFANDGTIDRETLLADTAYGQGEVLMNSLHQLVFFSPLLNEGRLTQPSLLLSEETESTESLFSETTVDTVRDMLVQSVTDPNGTARGLQALNYRAGAKTGTAEIAGEEGNQTNGFLYVFDDEDRSYSFIGFLEGQRSGDVVDRFTPFLNDLKPMLSE
ncbi:penicillin-binding protein PBP4(5) [Alkalibacterium sp. AK22]|uniref:penicillin-binding protein PBP4(5) n=1 Tax=Alkalibacterium sp. AK22 TaxID=1229520 RepID=UPI0005520CA8|nr:penicillin-binding transpeptidase domain-containing protein [Alkalibacterium sp. AK22]